MTKELSVIIPHYNSPQLLSKLLDSIPDRSDIEVIVVDDNSSSDMECYQQCVERNRQRNILFIKNRADLKGAGNARNLGIANATGKWLLFADADDFFLPGAFVVFEQYFDSALDIVCFEPTSIELQTGKTADRHGHYAGLVDDYLADPCKKTELRLRYQYWAPWGKMIRRELVDKRGIKFGEIPSGQDVMFSVSAGYYAKTIGADHAVVYCITKSPTSLTGRKDKKLVRSRQSANIWQLGFLISHLSREEVKMLGYCWKDYVYYYICRLKRRGY